MFVSEVCVFVCVFACVCMVHLIMVDVVGGERQ